MKKFLLSSAAIFTLAISPVVAADLMIPVEEPPVLSPIAAAPLWTGFYVGVQGGAAILGDDDEFDCDTDEVDFDAGIDPIGDDTVTLDYPDFDCGDIDFSGGDDDDDFTWVAGGHVGADVQYGSFVLGVLVDANWIDDDGNGGTASFDPDSTAGGQLYSNFADIPGFPDVFTLNPPDFDDAEEGAPYQEISTEHGLQWYGTGRVRAGFAPGGGRFLVYGTGGVSFGESESDSERIAVFTGDEADRYFADQAGAPAGDDEYSPGGGGLPDNCEEIVAVGGAVQNRTGVVCTESESDDAFHVGYAVGGGLEFLATDNFSLGAEALYVNLGNPGFDAFDLLSNDNDLDFITVMAKASFRFGGGR